jgi:hypothetical protein
MAFYSTNAVAGDATGADFMTPFRPKFTEKPSLVKIKFVILTIYDYKIP